MNDWSVYLHCHWLTCDFIGCSLFIFCGTDYKTNVCLHYFELTPSYKILAVDSIVNTTMNNNKFNTNFDLQLLLMSSQNQ